MVYRLTVCAQPVRHPHLPPTRKVVDAAVVLPVDEERRVAARSSDRVGDNRGELEGAVVEGEGHVGGVDALQGVKEVERRERAIVVRG